MLHDPAMLIAVTTAAFAADPAAGNGFIAGSYGRVQASTDLHGGGGDALDVVSHPPRTALGSYLELDLGWQRTLDDGASFKVLVTPALAGELFHYDGTFGADLAIRNLYASADRFVGDVPLEVWAGSRMYRGDDVYLLDFWPMDELNTVGGGVRWHPDGAEIAAHVGANRLVGGNWQVQDLVVAVPDSVQGETIRVLDRQRTIASLRLGKEFAAGDVTFRARLYGELHELPAGERVIGGTFEQLQTEQLPADNGSLVGLQLSAWGWANQSFVHLWVRRATGLAALDELAIPLDGLSPDRRIAPARSWRVALAGNTETDVVGVMAGAYVSYDVDADGIAVDADDRWEAAGVLRATAYAGEHVAIAVEGAHELVRPNGLNPRSGTFDVPHITKVSLLPGIQTAKGGFSRPRLQLVYTATFLGPVARRWFDPLDVRVHPGVQQYIGLGAEWWIDSQREITP
jgi:hypothetical protein